MCGFKISSAPVFLFCFFDEGELLESGAKIRRFLKPRKRQTAENQKENTLKKRRGETLSEGRVFRKVLELFYKAIPKNPSFSIKSRGGKTPPQCDCTVVFIHL